ncbi:MAG: pilin [bacterium]
MFKKYYNSINIIRYFVCIVFLLMFSINAVFAILTPEVLKDDNNFGLTSTAKESGFNTGTGNNAPIIANIMGDVIGLVLSLLGVIFMVIIIYSGFLWMTARGNEENAQKAKAIMTNAVIGVVIIFSAYAITSLLIDYLYGATKVSAPTIEARYFMAHTIDLHRFAVQYLRYV